MPIAPDQATEVLARAKMQKDFNPTTPNPAEKEAIKLKKAAEKARAEGQPPRNPLQEALQESQRLDHDASEKAIQKTFDENLDVATSRGADRKTTAIDGRDHLEKFLIKGRYELMSGTEKDMVRDQIKEVLSNEDWGMQLLDEVRGTVPADQDRLEKEFLDKWATDPEYRQTVRDMGKGIVENPPDMQAFQAAIVSAQEKVAEVDRDIEAKGEELRQNEKDALAASEALDTFDTKDVIDPRTGAILGKPKKEQAADLKNELTTGQVDYNRDLSQMNAILQKYGGEWNPHSGTSIDSNPEKFKKLTANRTDWSEYNDLLPKINTYELKQKKYDDLIAERDGIEARIRATANRNNEIITEISQAADKNAIAEADLELAKTSRVDAERAYAESFTHIYKEAMKAYMGKVGIELGAGAQAMVEETINDPATDPYTKAFLTGLKLRHEQFKKDHGFMHTELKRKVTGRETDKKSLQQDIDELKSTDPDAARQVLTRALFQATNPDTGQKYTATEASAFISANPDFVKNNIQLVTADIISRGLQTGQVRVKEMEKFVLNGHITNEKMVETFTKSQAMKKKLEQAGVTDSKLKEMGKRVGNKKLWMWLALFALSPMVATGVGLFVVGKDMVKPGPKEHGDGKKDEGKKDEPETTPETPEAEA